MTLSGATVLGQIVALLALPIITRIYPPGAYGTYLVLFSASSILGNVCTLRLERAIPIPAEDVEARFVARLALLLGFGLCAGLFLLTLFFGTWMQKAMGLHDGAGLMWVIPVGGFLTGCYLVAVQVSARFEHVRVIAMRSVLLPSVTVIVQVVYGLFWPSLIGLVIGFLLGRFVAAVLGRNMWLEETFEAKEGISYGWAFQRFWRFVSIGTPAALLNVLGLQLPVILFANVYGADAAGMVGLAITITMFPVIAISAAISQSMVGRVGSYIRNSSDGLFGIFLRWSFPIGGVSLIIGFCMWLAAPVLVPLLGPEWSGVTPLVQIMAVLTVFRMFGSSIAPVLGVLERHGLQMVADASRVLSICGALYFASVKGWPLYFTVAIMAILVSITYIVSWSFAGYSMWLHSKTIAANSEQRVP